MHTIAAIALNLSMFFYFIMYVPQLWRNLSTRNLCDMSLGFHVLLFIAATADLYYGFGRIVQWQYQAVSILMWAYLLIQHIQLYRFHYKQRNLSSRTLVQMHHLTYIIGGMVLGLYFCLHFNTKGTVLYIVMGWIERISYWLYAVPQLYKNKCLKTAYAISPWFMAMTIFTAGCDTISAWSYQWGSPSLYGAPIAILLHVILLWQWLKYKKSPSNDTQRTRYWNSGATL